MNRHQLAAVVLLALCASAWLRFADRPTRANLDQALVWTLTAL